MAATASTLNRKPLSMYAILQQSGHQYRVSPGDRLLVDRLAAEVGSVVALEPVVLVQGDDGTQVGTPVVDGVRVAAVVVSHRKGAKIRVFKYKPKKRYRRTHGHRSLLTELRIEAVLAAGEALPERKVEKAEKAEKPAPAAPKRAKRATAAAAAPAAEAEAEAETPAAETPAAAAPAAEAPAAEAPAAAETPAEAPEAPEATPKRRTRTQAKAAAETEGAEPTESEPETPKPRARKKSTES
jgi:large subunit ribosomal protein L21